MSCVKMACAWCRAGLDRDDPSYLEVALAAADLHVEASNAAAAQTIMQAVHTTLDQVHAAVAGSVPAEGNTRGAPVPMLSFQLAARPTPEADRCVVTQSRTLCVLCLTWLL